MGIRTMKFDLFVLKTLEKKGYTLDKLIELSESELDELNLPDKIITQIKGYKLRGGKTSQEVAEEIAALMEADSETNMEEDEVLSTYKEPVQVKPVVNIQTEDDAKEFIDTASRHVTEADGNIFEDLGFDSEEAKKLKDESNEKIAKLSETVQEVEIVRTLAKAEDIQIIKETLQKKELRSFASYTKLLKTEVPEAILSAVESTTLNTLIDERIAEVKASSTK